MKRRILFFIVSCYLFLAPCAWAVEIINIDKPKVRINVAPGKEQRGSIKVTNPTPEPKEVRVYLEDWYYLVPFDGAKEFKPSGSLPHSAGSWINFAPSDFTVPAYGSKLVSFTVKIPKEAKGGHYAVLFFEMMLGKPEAEEGVNVGVAVRIASLFYVEPKGTIVREAKVENLSLEQQANQLNIEADLVNIGNTDITSKGTFYIIDRKGIVYARGKFNDIYMLPGDSGRLEATAGSKLSAGVYDLIMTLQYHDGTVKVVEEAIEILASGRINIIPQ